jgi:hypothetical protein
MIDVRSDAGVLNVMLNDIETSPPFFIQCGQFSGKCNPSPGSSSNTNAFS